MPSARLVACAGAAQTARSRCTESFCTLLGAFPGLLVPLWGPSRAFPSPPRAATGPTTGLPEVKPCWERHSRPHGAPPRSPRTHSSLPRYPWGPATVPEGALGWHTVPMGPGYGAQGRPRVVYGTHGAQLRCPGGPRAPTMPLQRFCKAPGRRQRFCGQNSEVGVRVHTAVTRGPEPHTCHECRREWSHKDSKGGGSATAVHEVRAEKPPRGADFIDHAWQ